MFRAVVTALRDAATDDKSGGGRPGTEPQLVKDVAEVPFGRAGADAQALTDLAVGAARGNELQYLPLTPRQAGALGRLVDGRGPERGRSVDGLDHVVVNVGLCRAELERGMAGGRCGTSRAAAASCP